jgi:arabinose-5-phosphate isomerase
MDYTQIAKEVLITEAKELERSSALLGDEIGKIVQLVADIKGKLIITGVGKSGLVGSKMAATFASTGTSSFFLHPTEAMHGDFGMIGKDDALLAISYSGESEELIRILPHIKRFDIPLIGMAKDVNSTLGRYSDEFISIMIEKEACPLNTAPTSSTTLTMALGDALAVCLMKYKNFQKEDFASFHPGGSLGKQLFVKIKDIMRDKDLPIVSASTTLKDAIVVMSEGRLGNVLIADETGKLEGVLSDGDLRRALMQEGFSLENAIMMYATKNPQYIDNADLLASDAIKIVEEKKLQHLVVTDKNRVIKGVLHIHDLVEAGIK